MTRPASAAHAPAQREGGELHRADPEAREPAGRLVQADHVEGATEDGPAQDEFENDGEREEEQHGVVQDAEELAAAEQVEGRDRGVERLGLGQ